MKVLVCGGRNYGLVPKWAMPATPEYSRLLRKACEEQVTLTKTLSALSPRPTLIIHGNAQGADTFAKGWAKKNGVPDQPFRANWYPDGFGRLDKGAGPRRNQQMLDEGKPDLVVAFPGGAGTADMVRRAEAANLAIHKVL